MKRSVLCGLKTIGNCKRSPASGLLCRRPLRVSIVERKKLIRASSALVTAYSPEHIQVFLFSLLFSGERLHFFFARDLTQKV